MHDIVDSSEEPQRKLQGRILGPLRKILPDEKIKAWCNANRCTPRVRRFSGIAILWGCVLKHLQLISLRRLEDRMANIGEDRLEERRDGSAFSQARQRLSVRVFQQAVGHLGRWTSERRARYFHGFRIVLVDGTSSLLPGTPELKAAFGMSVNQYQASCHPLMRWVLVVCLGSGAVLDVAFGPFLVSELRLFLLLIRRVPDQSLIVGDALFCSYVHWALARERGCHLLCPRHGTRKDAFRIRLGCDDELHVWTRPRSLHVRVPDHLVAGLPEQLAVRVIRCRLEKKAYRTQTILLCTTLLDPQLYPAEELVALYAERWKIEGDLRHLKHHHGLDWLTAKLPRTVVRELLSGVLAYNAVKALSAESGAPPRSLSHTRVRDLVVLSADEMAVSSVLRLPHLYRKLIQLIGTCQLIPQERLPEPRVLVRDPRRHYLIIKVGRAEWKKTHAA